MDSEQKLKALARLWCKWNRKEIDGEKFAYKIGKIYNKEVLEVWNNPLEKLVV